LRVGHAVSAAGDVFAADGQGGPADLMAGAETLAGVTLEELVEQYQVAPVIRYHRSIFSVFLEAYTPPNS
jgi:hypothetical protein